jgi:hypothetical protein
MPSRSQLPSTLTFDIIAASSKHPHPSPPATMKLSWGLFFSSLYCTASAANPFVSPETARLIIAQRLGLSRFHSIEHADAEAIRHINAYGGRQQKLFGGDDADRSKAHLLMWIEDADEQGAYGEPPLPELPSWSYTNRQRQLLSTTAQTTSRTSGFQASPRGQRTTA